MPLRPASLALAFCIAACGGPPAPTAAKAADKPAADPAEVTTDAPGPAGDVEPAAHRPTDDPSPPSDEVMRQVTKGLNAFTADFYRLDAAEPGNRVLSPTSIAIALAMLHAGAKGDTAKEIADALHQSAAPAELHAGLAALLRRWNAGAEAYELSVVDRLFGDISVKFERDYLGLTGKVFGAELQPMNFEGAADASRLEINAWVASQTKKRIEELLPPRAIDASTRLVLVNAIYFKGKWAQEFSPDQTSDAPFFAAGGEANVPTMHRTGMIAHAAVADAKLAVVHLPYVGDDLAMTIILPDARDGLAELERSLDAEALERWLAAARPIRVDLALPKFRIEMKASLTLKAPLRELGIRRAFDATQADFTGIAPASEKLEITEGYHKAFIEVDEAGTEAAAATAIAMGRGAGAPPAPPVTFHADRPFLYLIRDTQSGAILFIGRVADPKSAAQ